MEVLNGLKNNFNRILKKIRGKESVFKIILGFVIFNLVVLTFWDKWDSTYGKTFYLIQKFKQEKMWNSLDFQAQLLQKSQFLI